MNPIYRSNSCQSHNFLGTFWPGSGKHADRRLAAGAARADPNPRIPTYNNRGTALESWMPGKRSQASRCGRSRPGSRCEKAIRPIPFPTCRRAVSTGAIHRSIPKSAAASPLAKFFIYAAITLVSAVLDAEREPSLRTFVVFAGRPLPHKAPRVFLTFGWFAFIDSFVKPLPLYFANAQAGRDSGQAAEGLNCLPKSHYQWPSSYRPIVTRRGNQC